VIELGREAFHTMYRLLLNEMVRREMGKRRGMGEKKRGRGFYSNALSTRQSLPMMLMCGGEIAEV